MKNKLNFVTLVVVFTLILNVTSYAQTAIKRPVMEEYTGAWCSSCGFGMAYFPYLESNYPNAIPIGIHVGDVMENFSITSYMTNYYEALPTFLFDRVDFPNNPNNVPAVSAYPWNTALDTLDSYLEIQYNQTPEATIGIIQTYDPITRTINATITANFIEDLSGDFRLNCFILEDSVVGGDEYNQSNSNFSGWTGGPSFLQSLIDAESVIVGFVHNHVVREMLGTPAGADAQIPTTVVNGASYSKTFTYVLPQEYREAKISLVGVLQRYGSDEWVDRNIVNANSQHLDLEQQTNNLIQLEKLKFKVYPNPIQLNGVVEFYNPINGNTKCQIVDLLGNVIATPFNQYLTAGEYRVSTSNLNLSKGMYLLKFTQEDYIQVVNLVVE
jgi:hypothetical protein